MSDKEKENGIKLDRAVMTYLRTSDFERLAKIAKEKGDIPESTLARMYIIEGIKRDESPSAEDSASK
jgi:hypothetical protein